MNTAAATAHARTTKAARPRAYFPSASADRRAGGELTRARTAGTFSLPPQASIVVVAEPGLVIRVHSGCLWVPHHAEHCSIGVGAGERFVVDRAGTLTVLASGRTEVELEWPSRERSPAGLH